jgi:hypothetical protein
LSNPLFSKLWVEISLDGFDIYENQRGIEMKLKDLSKLQPKILSLDTALFVGEKVEGNLMFVSDAVAQRVRFFTGLRSEFELMSQEDIFRKSHDLSMEMPEIVIVDISSFAVLLKKYYAFLGRETNMQAVDELFKELENFINMLSLGAASIFLETNIEKYKASSDYAEKTAYISEIMGFLYAMAQSSIIINDALTKYGPSVNNIYTSLKLEAGAVLGSYANDDRLIERLTGIAEIDIEDNEAVKNINKLSKDGADSAKIEDEIIQAINSMFNSAVSKQSSEMSRAQAIAASLYLFQLLMDYKPETNIDKIKNDIPDAKGIFELLRAA